MTIQQCRYVLKIAKTGSLSEAAKQLFIAQSSLSSSVKQLENELGIQIFERSNRGVFLTEEGAEFVRYASQMVEQSEFITERYRDGGQLQKLYVSTQHYDFVSDIFGRLLGESTLEKYRFSLRETRTYDVIREVETAFCDVGVLAIKDSDRELMERYLHKKGLFFTPFLHTLPHIFLRKGHPLAGKTKLTVNDLQEYPYVFYDQGEHNASFFTEELAETMIGERYVEISDRASLMNVLLSSDVYTIGTGIMPSELNGGSILSIPFESTEYYSVGYILRDDKKPSPLAKKFIDMLTEFVSSLPQEERREAP